MKYVNFPEGYFVIDLIKLIVLSIAFFHVEAMFLLKQNSGNFKAFLDFKRHLSGVVFVPITVFVI